MKRNNKLLVGIFGTLILTLMTVGCGSTSETNVDKNISSVSADTKINDEVADALADALDDVASDLEDISSEPESIAIEETVLYDANDILIVANSLEDGWMGTELKLYIENNSSKNITVQARKSSVNGFMVDTMMSADVAAGKKTNDELTFMTSGLKECGISQIASMEFSFHIFDSETWDAIVDTEIIRLDTSAASTYVQEVDDTGTVLVDANGIKIVGKGISDNDSFWGPGLILYVENNSGGDITIQVRDVSVNDFMVDSTMSEEVVSGKKAMSDVQFFSGNLEENNITDIEKVELYFHIFDTDSWNTIFDSDVITISF